MVGVYTGWVTLTVLGVLGVVSIVWMWLRIPRLERRLDLLRRVHS